MAKSDPLQQAVLSYDDILYCLNLGQSVNKGRKQTRSELQRGGTQVSAFRGSGFDYDDSREYQPGDDLRNLNWRLMARTAKPFTKLYQEEREASLMLLIDRRSPMRFGTRRHLKVTRALQLSCFLAGLYMRQGFSIGLALLQEQPVWIQPQRSSARIKDSLSSAAVACPPLHEHVQESSLRQILQQMLHGAPQGCQIIMLSDFHDLTQDERLVLTQLAARHGLQAYQILDPAELALPTTGVWQLKHGSDSLPVRISANDAQIARAYCEAMQHELTRVSELLQACRITCEQVYTDTPLDGLLGQIAYV